MDASNTKATTTADAITRADNARNWDRLLADFAARSGVSVPEFLARVDEARHVES